MHELNPDGTEARDEFGRVVKTYSNLDILSNARVMTGFTFTARRGNTEELFRSEKSRMDPLRIDVDKHVSFTAVQVVKAGHKMEIHHLTTLFCQLRTSQDFFPKPALGGGWLGDRYPLCVDLPEYHFLKLGAKYRFRGSTRLVL